MFEAVGMIPWHKDDDRSFDIILGLIGMENCFATLDVEYLDKVGMGVQTNFALELIADHPKGIDM